MKKSKIIALALAVTMLGGVFSSCANKKSGVYKVGILQLAQHTALDAATEGFKKALKDKLGDKVEFDFQNASGDSATCATIANSFVSSNVDLIMANATSALQAAAQATKTIPVVGTSITHYGTALNIENWTGKTGVNVTGTADLAPLDQQANMIKELVPNAKKVGILYCSAEANSVYQSKVMQGLLKKLGLTYQEYTFADSNDAAAVAAKAADESDVIYCPTDNTVATNGVTIYNAVSPKKKPIIAGEEGIMKKCGIATLSIKYYDIGYRAGEMAYKILAEGADPSTMDIEFSDKLTKLYIAERCTELNIKVPSEYTATTVDE